MKAYLPMILALAVGLAAGVYWQRGSGGAVSEKELASRASTWEREKEGLLRELAEARNRPPEIQTVYKDPPATFTNKATPREILDKLINLKPGSEESRNQTFRKIIFQLQSLADAGPYAFPVIRDFLSQNVDVDYSQSDVQPSGDRVAEDGSSGFLARNLVRTDYLVPPSLRLGLLSVLGQVGGAEAEQILAETLSTSARGIEVAYLARILQDLSPDRYREAALAAARELLSNPPNIEGGNKLDENAKLYLYEVLNMYRDTSFATTAVGLIVTPDGKVDRPALNYVNKTLKESAVPAILNAYNDPRLTNAREKSHLVNVALQYTGLNEQANQLFYQVMTNQTIPAGIRAFSVQSLAGTSQQPAPQDPYVLKARLEFLNNIKASLADERLLKALEATSQDLQKALSGQPASESKP